MTLSCCFVRSSARSLKCVLKNSMCNWSVDENSCAESISTVVAVFLHLFEFDFFSPTENWIISILSGTIKVQHLQLRLLFLELERQLNYFTAGRGSTLGNTTGVICYFKRICCWGNVALLPLLSLWEVEESLTYVVSLQKEEHHCCDSWGM